MIGACVCNRGSELGAHLAGGSWTPESQWHLIVEKNYLFLGLGDFEYGVGALVLDETNTPCWAPIGLFETRVQRIPEAWEIAFEDAIGASGVPQRHGWFWIAGYPELVRNETHREGMLLGDTDERAKFRAEHDRFAKEIGFEIPDRF